jgi:hypothetical protein
MERLFNAIMRIEGTANATAIMELLTTCSVTYIERRTDFGVKFRLTIEVNEVSYTIDGTIYDNGELFDSEYNFHNGEYEEYAGEGPIDFETLQACIEELVNF